MKQLILHRFDPRTARHLTRDQTPVAWLAPDGKRRARLWPQGSTGSALIEVRDPVDWTIRSYGHITAEQLREFLLPGNRQRPDVELLALPIRERMRRALADAQAKREREREPEPERLFTVRPRPVRAGFARWAVVDSEGIWYLPTRRGKLAAERLARALAKGRAKAESYTNPTNADLWLDAPQPVEGQYQTFSTHQPGELQR